MPNATLYLKTERNVEVTADDVFLKDIGQVYCSDKNVAAKVKAVKVHHFKEADKKRTVVSILKVIEQIEKQCPGVTVENIGETDMVLEKVDVNAHKGFNVTAKIILVALVSFFGTAFTIMAFHNDIGIQEVFARFHRIIMGAESDGFTTLEVSYSIGLAAGIIVFFNHVGGRRITKDPTPIEVAMRKYENDVNMTLVETADREGKEEDVH